MSVSLDRVVEVFLGIITLAIGFTSFWLATRSTRIQNVAAVKAVDAEAFKRAREIYESALDAIRKELEDTRKELDDTRKEMDETRKDLASARSELLLARGEIVGLHGDIARLGRQISDYQARESGNSQGGKTS